MYAKADIYIKINNIIKNINFLNMKKFSPKT
jgi:hypothetical protein